jgi:hypothetical protein
MEQTRFSNLRRSFNCPSSARKSVRKVLGKSEIVEKTQ